MNDHDELMNFFEVLTTLRDEYAKSDDSNKVKMISSIAQVAVEVIKCGKIPHCFQLKELMAGHSLLISPVMELFSRLSIELTIFDQGTHYTPTGACYYYVTFAVKNH